MLKEITLEEEDARNFDNLETMTLEKQMKQMKIEKVD